MERRVAGETIALADPEMRHGPVEKGKHVGMGDHDPLRLARGAGREEDVRGIVAAGFRRDGIARIAGDGARVEREVSGFEIERSDSDALVQAAGGANLLEPLRRLLSDDHDPRLGARDDPRQPRPRTVQIDRNVRAAGSQRSDHRHDRGRGLRQEEAHSIASLAAELEQAPSQAVGALVQHRVRQRFLVRDDRDRVGSPTGLLGDALVQRLRHVVHGREGSGERDPDVPKVGSRDGNVDDQILEAALPVGVELSRDSLVAADEIGAEGVVVLERPEPVGIPTSDRSRSAVARAGDASGSPSPPWRAGA